MRPLQAGSFGLVCLALGAGCEAESVPAGESCTTIAFESEIAVAGIDFVDLLIVLDDAEADERERVAMRRELARLVRTLLTGERPDGSSFEPLRDLHLGVLLADLGASGVSAEATGCEGWSRAGEFVAADACAAQEPAFLRYRVPAPTVHPLIEPPSDAAAIALVEAFECTAATDRPGCGFGQPLEAALRALWPAAAQPGYGDPPHFDGPKPVGDSANAEFLRSDPRRGLSLLHVLLVTDGDDCSMRDTALFANDDGAAALSSEAHCAANPDRLHAIERYVTGLRGLRPDQEALVSFAAIAGVPADLTAPEQLPLDVHDEAERAAWYAAVLADARMQPSQRADGTLAPSCESEEFSATPPRRVVELARAFGARGRVHSICAGGFWPAVEPLTEYIAKSIGAACLPRRFARDRDGLTPCRVLWELPPPEHALEGTPTACDQRAFLSVHEARPVNERGGAVCEVRQLAVRGLPDATRLEPGEGWFYDDFSEGPHCACPGDCNTIFFKPDVPPSGVRLKLQCGETRRPLPMRSDLDTTVAQPQVFDGCDPRNPHACVRVLADPRAGALGDGADRELFCQPQRRQCVLACDDGACPEGWSCSDEGVCEPLECAAPR